jgi:3-hydroxyacyl-[acyl-carrier-protein] dehydratase
MPPKPDSLLPHRPPFLFVDELVELVPGERAEGYWRLRGDEWFFPGHFPDRPTLPGVLMLEALAQLGACAVLADDRYRGKLPLFGGADKIKFRRQVSPGDQLDLSVTMDRLGSRAGRGTGIAKVGDETAAQASLMFVLVDG